MSSEIILISCVKTKRADPCAAIDLYISPLFKKMLAYARKQKPEKIFILSAKHGLLTPDTMIGPYEQTLSKMPVATRKAWAARVLMDLQNHVNLDADRFVFLAGARYREDLAPHMKHVEVPMEGLPMGPQLKWLNEQLA